MTSAEGPALRSARVPPETKHRATPRFDQKTTGLYALLWLLLVVHGWWPVVEYDPIWWLQSPTAAAQRVTTRDLELSEAISATDGLSHDTLAFLYEEPTTSRERSVEVLTMVLDAVEQDGLPLYDTDALAATHARLAILLAESGDLTGAREAALEVDAEGAYAAALSTAYAQAEGPKLEPTEAENVLRDAGLTAWYLDRARAALMRSGDRTLEAREIEGDLRARGARWLDRTIAIAALNAALIAIGLLLAVLSVRRFRHGFPSSESPPAWTLEDGIGVFVRGDFWNRAYFVGVTSLAGIPGVGATIAGSAVGNLLSTWATLFAAFPLLWLVHHHLLAPNGLTARAAFGLAPNALSGVRLLGLGFFAIAIDLAGTYLLGLGAFWLGFESSWTEGFDETLVFASRTQAWLTTVDYTVWAPSVEELAFRGVLFFSLRHRLGPLPAALATAVFFAGMHLYSLPGFLVTLWSGFVWALAFERSGSLLPGLGAHAFYNGLYVAGLVLLYR